MAKKPVRLRMKLLGVFLSILFGLLIAEIGVRIAVPVVHVKRYFVPGIYAEDTERGWANVPSYEGVFTNYYEKTAVNTNSYGFRCREPGPGDLEAPIRVLCLGDSTTFGYGTRNDETFPHQLERDLRAEGTKATVWNAGVCGYNTKQAIATLKKHGPVLKPHVVMLGWLVNDLLPWTQHHAPKREDEDVNLIPEVIDGYLVEDEAAFERFRDRMIVGRFWEHSQLAKLVSVKVRGWRHAASLEERVKKDERMQMDPNSFDANLELVKELQDVTTELGAELVVLAYSAEPFVVKGKKDPTVEKFISSARTEGIEVVSVYDIFRPWYERESKSLFVPRDYGHPNGTGHGLTAEAVAPLVQKLALGPK